MNSIFAMWCTVKEPPFLVYTDGLMAYAMQQTGTKKKDLGNIRLNLD